MKNLQICLNSSQYLILLTETSLPIKKRSECPGSGCWIPTYFKRLSVINNTPVIFGKFQISFLEVAASSRTRRTLWENGLKWNVKRNANVTWMEACIVNRGTIRCPNISILVGNHFPHEVNPGPVS